MKLRYILMLILLALLLGGCSYWVIEEPPMQVGSAIVQPTAIPAAR